MPFAGFEDFSSCKRTMMDEEGHDEDAAERICGALQAESKNDNGNVEELRDALARGQGLLSEVGVELNSAVDLPAIDSEWVAFKSETDGYDRRIDTPIVRKADGEGDDAEKRIAYAPAMIPREPDKEGDVVATPTVERAAHDYLAEGDPDAVDSDHDLIDGKGTVVESWILDEDKSYETPGGEAKAYPAGTWMLGIKWEAEPWDRIQAGELEGLSIHGQAEKVPLARSVSKALTVPFADEVIVDLVYGAERAAEKAAAEMGMAEDAHEHELDGRTVFMPGPDHETYVETYNDLAESDGTEPVAETAKDDEDPCWEGYTMVGTQENGDPRCVPDDEVPDADFSESLTPAETKAQATKGATLNDAAGESDKQNSMTDTDSDGGADGDGGGGDSPTVDDVAASVDDLRSSVEEIKDALPDDGSTDKADGMDDLVDSVAQQFAALDEVERDSAELAEAIRSAVARENGDMMDDDEEDDDMEDMEESAEKSASGNVEKGHGTGADGAAATGDADGATSGNPLNDRASVLEDR